MDYLKPEKVKPPDQRADEAARSSGGQRASGARRGVFVLDEMRRDIGYGRARRRGCGAPVAGVNAFMGPNEMNPAGTASHASPPSIHPDGLFIASFCFSPYFLPPRLRGEEKGQFPSSVTNF